MRDKFTNPSKSPFIKGDLQDFQSFLFYFSLLLKRGDRLRWEICRHSESRSIGINSAKLAQLCWESFCPPKKGDKGGSNICKHIPNIVNLPLLHKEGLISKTKKCYIYNIMSYPTFRQQKSQEILLYNYDIFKISLL